MYLFRAALFVAISVLTQSAIHAQRDELAIGAWRDHLPYSNSNSITEGNGVIYCGSEAGFIAFDQGSKEIKRYTRITGLSDVGVSQVKYNKPSNVLLIAYRNGNIDLMKFGKIRNLPAIKDANIIADKTIHNIFFDGYLAYLSCGFGIVVLDLNRLEVTDTYLIGNNSEPIKINDTYVHHASNTIYAATETGIYEADIRNNLADYSNWSKQSALPDSAYNLISFFNNKLLFAQVRADRDSDLILGMENGVVEVMVQLDRGLNNQILTQGDHLYITKEYNVQVFNTNYEREDLIYGYDNSHGTSCQQTLPGDRKYYFADRELGLVEFYSFNNYAILSPNGPNSLNISNIDVKNNTLWATNGLLDPGFRESFSLPIFNVYQSLTWTGMDYRYDPLLDSSYGYIKIESDPRDRNHAFASSWDNGLVELRNGTLENVYDVKSKVTTGHSLTPIIGSDKIRSGGLAYDNHHNLWITCSETPYALNVYTVSGEWYRYFLGAYVDDGTIVGDLIVDQNGYKWILLNRDLDTRIVVFDDNDTPEDPSDDRSTSLGPAEGSGNLPGSVVNCIAVDLNGSIWIGTDEGPAVFYSPSSVFSSNIDAQQIFVQQDGLTQILLETENVKTISIDGANRKWFGTENSGAYLMSSDGTQQINHFTAENSPLFSNDIKDIEIDETNGEIFFCTSEGLISYKGTATKGGDDFSDVQVFPNPVPQGYGGVIAIKGMATNANVKITDINGILIYETIANGGQAIWNGISRQGRRAQNGVYLVFSTDESGEYQNVTKFLFLNN